MKKLRLWYRLVLAYVLVNWKFFILGLVVSAALVLLFPKLPNYLPQNRSEVVGLVGNFTISNLPATIQSQISIGLTQSLPDGQAASAAALSWEATDSGRLVTFHLDPKLHWQDGQALSAQDVNYNLKSVTLSRPSNSEVTFSFKDPFAPLTTIVSQPLFKDGLIGLGQYKVDNIKFNGRFLSSLALKNLNDNKTTTYKFYPSEAIMLTALKLGSVTSASGVYDPSEFTKDQHYKVSESIDAHSIVTIFFNTQKDALSDRSTRQALTYALQDSYQQGDRAYSPLPKGSWVGDGGIKKYPQNLTLAKSTLSKASTSSAVLKIVLSSNVNLLGVTQQVASSWRQAGVNVEINQTDVLPTDYDAYLTYLEVPTDPDQYMLWHSTQIGNITRFKSPKIDKLLEDGRKTLDIDERQNIYENFQKAITEEIPAIFLFYPKLYTVTRN